jgi:hypothetical protein
MLDLKMIRSDVDRVQADSPPGYTDLDSLLELDRGTASCCRTSRRARPRRSKLRNRAPKKTGEGRPICWLR